MGLGVDFLALSFVRQAADVVGPQGAGSRRRASRRTSSPRSRCPRPWQNIDEILDVSDGIMVARGDLGVELPPEMVPVAQRQLVARARAAEPSRRSSPRRCWNR